MQERQRVTSCHEEEQEAGGDGRSPEDWKCWCWERDDQGTVGDGTGGNDGKETRKDWGEQDIGCSTKVYGNLSVESGGSSGGSGEGDKRLDWRSGDSTHN